MESIGVVATACNLNLDRSKKIKIKTIYRRAGRKGKKRQRWPGGGVKQWNEVIGMNGRWALTEPVAQSQWLDEHVIQGKGEVFNLCNSLCSPGGSCVF